MTIPLTDEQLKMALQQHTQWLINPSLGKRLNTCGANLQNAIFQGANLQGVIGDGTIIRSAQFDKYLVVSCDDWLQLSEKAYNSILDRNA